MAFFCQIYKDWKLELFRSYSTGTSHKFQHRYDFLYPEFLLIYVWSYAQFDLLTGSAVIKSMYWENLYQSRSKLTSLKTFSFNGHVLEINVYKSNKELFPHSYILIQALGGLGGFLKFCVCLNFLWCFFPVNYNSAKCFYCFHKPKFFDKFDTFLTREGQSKTIWNHCMQTRHLVLNKVGRILSCSLQPEMNFQEIC